MKVKIKAKIKAKIEAKIKAKKRRRRSEREKNQQFLNTRIKVKTDVSAIRLTEGTRIRRK